MADENSGKSIILMKIGT